MAYAEPSQGGFITYTVTCEPEVECPHCLRHVQNGFMPTQVYGAGTVLHHGLHNAQARNSVTATVESEERWMETVTLGVLNAEKPRRLRAGKGYASRPLPNIWKRKKKGVKAKENDFQKAKGNRGKGAKTLSPRVPEAKRRSDSIYSTSTNTTSSTPPQSPIYSASTNTNTATESILSEQNPVYSASTNPTTNSTPLEQTPVYYASTYQIPNSILPGQNPIYFTSPDVNTAANPTLPGQNFIYSTSPDVNTAANPTLPGQNFIYSTSPDVNTAANSTLPGQNFIYSTSPEVERRQNSVHSISSDADTPNSTPPEMWVLGSAFNRMQIATGMEETYFDPTAWPPTTGFEFNQTSSNAPNPQLFMDTAGELSRQTEPSIPSFY